MGEVITMDAVGRLVIPKSIRTRLHLQAGARLLVREDAGHRLVLEPVTEQGVPFEVDGLLVIRGRLLGEIPDHREQRKERLRSLGRALR